MNPSTLAQIIPATRQKQNAWLRALQNWCEGMASRSNVNNYRCLFFEWAATNYPGVTYSEANGVRHAQRPMSLAVGTIMGKLHTSAICAKGIHPFGC